MTADKNTLSLEELPREARQELIDFYEFLKKKHSKATQPTKSSPFQATEFRGILHYPTDRLNQHLEQLRREWDRTF